jgi:hypothetical protein
VHSTAGPVAGTHAPWLHVKPVAQAPPSVPESLPVPHAGAQWPSTQNGLAVPAHAVSSEQEVPVGVETQAPLVHVPLAQLVVHEETHWPSSQTSPLAQSVS